ncbi:uncharacterized protein [Primulina eburnea]|uniref:uncharacterized protein n=1 Tax=Primulina eburnea TaxID=1245227 RepID=UPI003C6C0AB4
MGWDRFAEELIKHYGGYDANPFELMASLTQGQQSIDAYIERFEMLVVQLGEVQEDQCLGYFMSGLREEIRRRMIVHAPRSVDRAMMLARGLEEELYGAAVDKGKNKVGSSLVYAQKSRCANKSLRVTILAEEEGEDAEWEQVELEERNDEVTREMGEVGEPNVEYNTLELPLYSVNGINHPQTLKMRARLAGREVVAMVDTGSSHNFVSKKLIAELGLVCDESIIFGVCLGDGCRVSCQGVCRELEVDFGQCIIKIEGYLFELGGIDLILGVDWLRTLGDVLLNWDKMEMRFSWDNQTVEFCGAILVKWGGEEMEVIDKEEDVEAMNNILAEYEGVFQEPSELPPCRRQDHAICIKEGCGPVSIRVQAADVHKTAFRTNEGHYEFLVMPFGLKNAPPRFQSTMNEVFRPYLRKFVLVFFDDVLIYSKNWEEHVQHVESVFKLLQQHQLVLNRKKCKFGLRQVEYLGHIIMVQGVEVDPNRVESVIQWPHPKKIKRLRSFLGLTGYYRKFIKDYGKIARPLTEQLKKNNFGWNDKAQEPFEMLKQAVVTTLVLRMPDFSQEFLVECDASGWG